jgi:excisionase family DNA binding protein
MDCRLSKAQAAEYLGVSCRTIDRLRARGRLRCIVVGGVSWIWLSELNKVRRSRGKLAWFWLSRLKRFFSKWWNGNAKLL